eukprot:scaffold844_cov268-Chaetoceros_neogracile.AAC.33
MPIQGKACAAYTHFKGNRSGTYLSRSYPLISFKELKSSLSKSSNRSSYRVSAAYSPASSSSSSPPARCDCLDRLNADTNPGRNLLAGERLEKHT